MARKKIIKAFGLVIGFDIVTSLLLLMILDIQITQQTFLITSVFSVILVLLLDKFNLLQKE